MSALAAGQRGMWCPAAGWCLGGVLAASAPAAAAAAVATLGRRLGVVGGDVSANGACWVAAGAANMPAGAEAGAADAAGAGVGSALAGAAVVSKVLVAADETVHKATAGTFNYMPPESHDGSPNWQSDPN